MIRKVKAGMLGMVLSLVLLGSLASGAGAASFHSTAGMTPLKGSQILSHNLTFDPGTVNCTSMSLSGELWGSTVSWVTLTPTYKNCVLKTIFGNISVTVDFKGCDYAFDADGTIHIVCNSFEGPVTISGPGCTVTLPEQTIYWGNSYWNRTDLGGNVQYIEGRVNASGIKYSYTGFTCGSGSNTTNGTYTGYFELWGSGGTDIWHE